MVAAIPPRARVIIGATTVALFLVVGVTFLFSDQSILGGLVLLLAALRFILLLKQLRVARRRSGGGSREA